MIKYASQGSFPNGSTLLGFFFILFLVFFHNSAHCYEPDEGQNLKAFLSFESQVLWHPSQAPVSWTVPSHWPSIPPVDGVVTSTFGLRKCPLKHKQRMHYGLDIGAPLGSPVYATAPGWVVQVGVNGSHGRWVRVDHGRGVVTFYGHVQKIYVSSGQKVQRGQVIASVGNTGRSTGPHLHYEVRFDGQAKDPPGLYFLNRCVWWTPFLDKDLVNLSYTQG